MTRDNDEDRAGNDLRASLDYRAAMAEKNNADAFISIHTNGVTDHVPQDKYSGFDIYVPKRDSKFYEGSVRLASSIAGFIKPDYVIAAELKEGKERIRVLDHSTVPAIVIECGYMDNTSDLAYLLDEKSQEKIARDILEGIKKYSLREMGNSDSEVSVNNWLNENNELKETNNISLSENASDSSVPLRKVEVQASFPGGEEGWKKYLMKTLKYPEEAQYN
jgi:hypothetical protein